MLGGFTLSFLNAKNVTSTVTNTVGETTTMSVGSTTTVTQVIFTTSTLQVTTQLRFPQLVLQLSTTTISSGQELSINVYEYNPFLNVLNVSAATQFLESKNISQGIECGYYLPFGVSVFSGYYSALNFTKGSPLSISDNWVPDCVAEAISPAFYEFSPSSYNATIFSNASGSSNSTEEGMNAPMEASVATTGYWASIFPYANTRFQSFPSDVYTVVTCDDWGEVEVAHFTVLPNAT
jgi:hypothetical protein